MAPPAKLQASDVVFGEFDLDLLSHTEQVELSELAAIINRAGNIWALNTSQFERVRALVHKGVDNGAGNDGNDDGGTNATRH
jgi:hypothetical protein